MTMPSFRFVPATLPPEAPALRAEVRQFIAEERERGSFRPQPGSWGRFDTALARRVGARGWIGMPWPKKYGGQGRSMLERYVVYEELLGVGFPIRAFYPPDRQVGPLILKYGSEELKLKYLPRMAAGECGCAVGFSEPDSGSDLAAIRTMATKVEGGWRVQGQKVWISNAHRCELLSMLLRTRPLEADHHKGLSRFLVDMSTPGITVRPIIDMTGSHVFNEVIFDQVFVPDNMVLGKVDDGWRMLGHELAYERSTPDQWLAFFETLKLLIDELGPSPSQKEREVIGRFVSHLWTLREMSLSIAGMIDRGEVPNVEAAIVKDLGTTLDQEVPHAARLLVDEETLGTATGDSVFNRFLNHDILFAPCLSIKGGTREILRNAIARGLGLR